ncbi:MAG TPA: PTS system mannose/fructose/sorbose family transporter subunit IID, partial [Puia sp.]|nr:PTS system mannose/fructose/sorbose family transporter subunit IID [Puia sp.]
ALVGFLSLRLGAGAMKTFLDLIPAWVNTGLQVAGNLLPALGFALLMNLLLRKALAPYFFLGFLLAAFVKLPVIAIGGLGVIIALLVTQQTGAGVAGSEDGEDETGDTANDAGDTVNQTGDAANQTGDATNGSRDPETETAPALIVVTNRDLRHIFFRSMLLEANFNFETWQNTGFAFAMMPVLKKLYKTKESMAAALQRHLQLFNTSTYGCTLILGLTTAMEEQNSRDVEFNADSINSVKLGLMGPLAGVFDSLFWGTLKVIAAGVGTSLALKGNVSGVILFILLFNVPHLLLRYQLTFIGYKAGTRFLQKLSQSNVMDRLTQGAAILGLMVVGAMPATLMNIHTPVSFGEGAGLQGILDQIVPALVPLGLTFLVYYFVKKGVKTTYLLLGLLGLGFAGSLLHWLA